MVSSSCEAFQTHYHHAFDIFETMGKKSNSGPLCCVNLIDDEYRKCVELAFEKRE